MFENNKNNSFFEGIVSTLSGSAYLQIYTICYNTYILEYIVIVALWQFSMCLLYRISIYIRHKTQKVNFRTYTICLFKNPYLFQAGLLFMNQEDDMLNLCLYFISTVTLFHMSTYGN